MLTEPDDGPEHLFLPRAVRQIASILSEGTWDAALSAAPKLPSLPDSSDGIYCNQLEEAAEIIRSVAPQLLPNNSVDSLDNDWVLEAIPWERAVQERSAMRQKHENNERHLCLARDSLLKHLRLGTVETFTRSRQGGPHEFADPAIWNFELWQTRFAIGTIKAGAPYNEAQSTDDHYLFVSRSSLHRCFPQARSLPPLELIWDGLSLTMRVAVRASIGIQEAGEQPSRAQLEETLAKLAMDEGAAISADVLERLVTVIRSPEAAKGWKQKKSAG